MLHSRLRPLPRTRNTPPNPAPSSVPRPEFDDPNESDSDESPEDLFTAFLPHLFPDDAPSFHGDPGQRLLYSSPRYGDLEIMVPSYPNQSENRSDVIAAGLPRTDDQKNPVEEGRKLFAHFLWSAAMVVADEVEKAQTLDLSSGSGSEAEMWKVDGENVLELGAGAALPSIICALADAKTVTITDHPSSPALTGAIAFNVDRNLYRKTNAQTQIAAPTQIQPQPQSQIHIRPHEWGVLETDPWAVQSKGGFTRIIAADCYWMPEQHENLVRTMRWFLAPGGKVWVVAGFHTGRAIVAAFFRTAVQMGMEIELIYERDLVSTMEDGRELRRDWVEHRQDEGLENRRRWCVIALLRGGENGV